eukprot:4626484-Alexandrium_andersonii.AAC.1
MGLVSPPPPAVAGGNDGGDPSTHPSCATDRPDAGSLPAGGTLGEYNGAMRQTLLGLSLIHI